MIRSLSYLLVLALVIPSQQQSTPLSPCPNVFMYEPPGTEPGRWYGVVNLSTDSTLHSLWLNIVLDSKADILGNWVGDVTTADNVDFKIENTKMKIHPGPATSVRFFVQYSLVQNKAPRLQAIRLNGREICNANNPLPAIDRPDRDDGQNRPDSGSRPNVKPEIITKPESTRPNNWNVDRPRPSVEGPVYVPTENPPIDMTYVHPNSIGDGQVPAQSVGTPLGNKRPSNNGFLTTAFPPIRNNQNNRDDPSDYFEGGQPVIIVPNKPNRGSSVTSTNSGNRGSGQCGKVMRNNPVPLVVNGTPTLEGQWPWQIALYQTQTVDNKYICGGTLVTHKHVITAAHCVTRKGSSTVVNPNTLTVYLGKHNLRTSVEGVQIKLVGEIIVHPQYNASSFSRDLGILTLREPVQYTDFVRPACLWPENLVDLSNVIGRKGSVVGWGFDDKGIATEELTLVEMPVVDQETCIRSYSEFFARFTSDFTFCAGYRNGTSVCNGDSGGGMVFLIENSWYLRGLVSLSVARQNEYRCDPTHFVVFTDLAKFLPWIKQYLSDY